MATDPTAPAKFDWREFLQKALYWLLIALAGAGGGAVSSQVCAPGCNCQHAPAE